MELINLKTSRMLVATSSLLTLKTSMSLNAEELTHQTNQILILKLGLLMMEDMEKTKSVS